MTTQQNTFSIQFYIKKSKIKRSGEAPIYTRITVNGKRVEIAIKRNIHIDKWDNKRGYARGTTEYARSLNTYIDTVRNKLYEKHRNLIEKNKNITAIAIKDAFFNKGDNSKTFVGVFEYHNKQMEALVGKEYAQGTHKRYETSLKHLTEFMQSQYNISDILLSQLNYQFITDFDFYLRTTRNCNNNSTVKYIRNIRKIIKIAVDNEWVGRDPFVRFRTTIEPVERDFLTDDELHTIEEKKFKMERLEIVKDIFVFSCYTGYSYAEVEKLTPEDIGIGMDGEKWIYTYREKTKVKSNVPLLPKALEIIEKYKDHAECKISGKMFPIRTNQKMNAYLKEIADLCEIQKNLTFHIARHTFATTVTLTNGVPIESVSNMLGHKNIRTTQIYSKVVEKKVSEDMLALKDKLLSKTKAPQKQSSN